MGSSDRSSTPGFGRLAPRSVLAVSAAVFIVAWLLTTVPASVSRIPVRELGASLVGGALIGIGIGARARNLPPVVAIVGVIAAGAAIGRVALAIGHRVGLVEGRSETTILAIAVISLVVGVVIGRSRGSGPRPTDVLVGAAVWSFVVVDLRIFGGAAFRDLGIYLRAGRDYLDGDTVYTLVPLTSIPPDTSQFPFVYPPITLPFFGLLAALPRVFVVAAWEIGSVATAVFALRWFGVSWLWVPVLLAWPPFVEGLWVGNVAIPSILFLAAGFRVPWLLLCGPVFKLQFGASAPWIVRERRWADLLIGLSVLFGLAVITLPFVGIGAWASWIQGLQAFQASGVSLPALFGSPLSAYLPYAIFLMVATATILAGVVASGRAGLSRLAVGSVVASPTLYRHGLLPLLPGLLRLDEVLLWVALGIVTNPTGMWLSVSLAGLGTFWSRRSQPPHSVHPIGGNLDVWPVAIRSGTSSAPMATPRDYDRAGGMAHPRRLRRDATPAPPMMR